MAMRWVVTGALVAVTIAGMSCNRGKAGKSDDGPAAPTYYGDVKPLLDARCTGCHAQGGVAFSLASYDAVRAAQTSVVSAVAARRMPVWLAASGHTAYKDDPAFSDAEIKTLQKWQDGGFARGDEQARPAAASGAFLRDLEGDLTLPLLPDGVSYMPDQVHPDDYRCFIIDWPYTDQVKYITGLQGLPGNRAVVHHLVAHNVRKEMVPLLRKLDAEEDGLGYKCFGGALPDRLGDPAVQARIEREFPGVLAEQNLETQWLGHWAPGMRGNEMPDGTGIPVAPGGVIVVQVHYYSATSPNSADSGSAMRFRLADKVEKPGFVLPLTENEWIDAKVNRSLVVPPGQELSVHTAMPLARIMQYGASQLGFSQATKLTVYSSNLHMHSFGKSAITYLTDAAGKKDVLLEIPNWNLNWQRDYTFVEPRVFDAAAAKDAAIHVECTYANHTDHEVYGGFGSGDEMCFNFAFMTVEGG